MHSTELYTNQRFHCKLGIGGFVAAAGSGSHKKGQTSLLNSRQNALHYLSMDIGKAEIAALKAVRQACVVQAQQV